MSVLPDREIRIHYPPLLEPFREDLLQPASVDLTLGDHFLAVRHSTSPLDPTDLPGDYYAPAGLTKQDRVLHPGQFLLATTSEQINVPDNIVALISGKSTLGRLGLLVHVTAGLIDPGFSGKITLELSNIGPRSIQLTPGMRIAQVSFTWLTRPAETPYGSPGLGSHYQGQQDVAPAR